ncbi:DNA repair protein RecN [Acetobacter orleanensis]|uniref:DNA repair protein RecN n=1 Tax=Acetobacter orleanensis TaxID=104099 RepID=A0A4Y3TPF7_9PROT|nr:DNA repair protein RecN [Acetobacter orleanensis]KXV63543.1 DNA recombination protein RecN [Acetobacter orleanensis]PCD79892.1 DNA repair protein RecN [Acetobacter orleanensis]GAN68190.1 DNA repair protein RecN [Acetobacter orleanensis JCM 7639]GBR31462.1 DNA repair protein RecN [Acetobacter orleanensis NRIC 0473]GEB82917.1 DNA repair protein RecN [Acetobacter orleanensis]
MLTNLSIRDVVLIEALDLSLHAGFTALTGETGAGKSILLDSLGLALGERANAGLVRAGAEEARVTASFDIPQNHAAYDLLKEQGIPAETGEPLMLRRIVSAEGRSRAWINDQPVGITLMRRVAVSLVEIQGQHEQMGLADSSTHRGLLDAYGVPTALLRDVSCAFDRWQTLRRDLEAARKSLQDAAREEDWLRHTVEELTTLNPQADEEEQLALQRHSLQQSERRGEAITAALAELTPRDRRNSGPAAALRGASRALQRLLPAPSAEQTAADPLEIRTNEALNALESAENALAEAETLLSRLADDSEANPRLLEEIEERLFTLRAAARKHDVTVDSLPALLADLSARLVALETGATQLDALEQAVKDALTQYEQAATGLSAARDKASRKMEQAVTRELKPIKLERARFFAKIEPLPPESWSRHGMEQVTFLIAANPGQPPGPLAKVASGGELSRLMLALKLVLAGQSGIGTLVFDEIDAGVGGATAAAIGERLHRLAKTVQVLAVTHSPQVAASADAHLRIGKIVRDGQTATHAAPLSQSERQEEIARMLAGDVITDAARAAAASLLKREND